MDHLTVADVMTKDVVCVPPDCDLESLRELLLACGISGAPVVDGTGCVLGVVSKTDLLRVAEGGEDAAAAPAFDPTRDEAPPRARTVRDVMTLLAFTVRESDPLQQAAALLAFEGVHRAPVVSMQGRVVGMLSAIDIVRAVGAAR